MARFSQGFCVGHFSSARASSRVHGISERHTHLGVMSVKTVGNLLTGECMLRYVDVFLWQEEFGRLV